jgi:dihydroxyacid dehydratase/phosphogluconate dehydratase
MTSRPAIDKAIIPSRHVTEGVGNAFHRTFYYAMGLDEEAIHQAHVGIATAWHSGLADSHLEAGLAEIVKQAVWACGATPREFATVCDSPANPLGPRDLLVREIVADSIELTVRGHWYDGLVVVAPTADTIAAGLMALARLDLPGVMVAVPRAAAGSAAVMAQAACALGLAVTARREATEDAAAARRAGQLVVDRIATATTARQAMTVAAFRSAIAVLAAGGAVSECLTHILAVAHECGVTMTETDIDTALGERSGILRGAVGSGIWTWPDRTADDFDGTARVFAAEADAVSYVRSGAVRDGDVITVGGAGPVGGPAMPALAVLSSAIARAGRRCAVLTDGRMLAVDSVLCVTQLQPEVAAGGRLGEVADGAPIRLDLSRGTIEIGPGQSAGPPRAGRVPSPAALGRYAADAAGGHGPGWAAATHPGAASELVRYMDQ